MSNEPSDPFAENEDPWAGVDDADEFETPKTAFLGLIDLEDRLIVIDVLKTGTKRGTDGDYDYAECNVLVVDGEPIDGFLPAVPGVVERMHISATAVYDAIEHLAGKRKPFLCRPDVFINKRKQKVAGVRKHEVTDADKAAASGPWRRYRAGEFDN